MPDQTKHLQKSRHGIWYFRWVLPHRLRTQHPTLPRELKRSTRTADIRHARVIARRLHRAFTLQYAMDLGMNAPWPDLSGIRKFDLKIDPTTGRVIHLNAEPHEVVAAMAALERIHQINLLQAEAMDLISRRAADRSAEAQATPSAAGGTATAVPGFQATQASPTISQAFADWSELQRQSGSWLTETFTYTHEPTNRIFRELVGEPVPPRLNNDEGIAPAIDLELARLTPEKMARFIKEFWDYPSRQGKRPAGKTARDVLTIGGAPQKPSNAYKRLRLISQFIEHCVEKSWVDPKVLKELEIVLSKDSPRARAKRRAASPDDEQSGDGYLSFTNNDLRLLFGAKFRCFVKGRAQRAAAAYWLPLIGLFSAMRVAEMSALEVSDFVVIDGVQCVRVREHEALSPGVEGNRLKTVGSRRTVPLHPKLVELGLLEYVEQRRQAGERHLWDGLNWEAKSGYGRYPSSDFRVLAKAVEVYVERRKVLHSFRSTLSQALESAGMAPEPIDRLLGHEVKSTRGINYSRSDNGTAVPMALMHRQLSNVTFPIDVEPWGKLDLPFRGQAVEGRHARRKRAAAG